MNTGKMQRTVLGFSGSAATAAAIGWLREQQGQEVVTVTLDVGQGDELAAVREQALALGAVRAHVIDAREELVRDYLLPALQAGALMDGYALTYPLLAKRLVDIARMESASAIAHAAKPEGGGVLDSAIRSIDPAIEITAVLAQWNPSDAELSALARHRGLHAPVSSDVHVEASVWGRRLLGATIPDEAFTLTRNPQDCPEDPAFVDVALVGGVPVSANGVEMSLNEMLESLETIAGAHGVGRSHFDGTALEAPAARVLSTAYAALERCALGDDMAALKRPLAGGYARTILSGRWFSDLREGIDAFARVTSACVTGTVRLRLSEGQCSVVDCSVESAGKSESATPKAVA
jgi:argininosuccinate synthase